MDKINYYQIIEGSEMYYPWYVHKLENDIKVLRQLLARAYEGDFGLDQIAVDDDFDFDKFYEDTNAMNSIDSMLYYTERWMDKNKAG